MYSFIEALHTTSKFLANSAIWKEWKHPSLIYVLLFSPSLVLVASIVSRPRLQAAFGVDDVSKITLSAFSTLLIICGISFLVLVYLVFYYNRSIRNRLPAGQARDKWFCTWIPLSGILTQSTQKFVLHLYISCTATFLLSIMHLQIFNDHIYQKYNKCKGTIWFYMWFLFLPTVTIEVFCLVASTRKLFCCEYCASKPAGSCFDECIYIFIARWN